VGPNNANAQDIKLSGSIVRQNVKLGVGSVHRYQIPVLAGDAAIEARIGMSKASSGAISIAIFTNDGQIIEGDIVNLPQAKSPALGLEKAVRVPVKKYGPGLYEVLVYGSQAPRQSKMEYDLVLGTIGGRSNLKQDRIILASSSSASASFPDHAVISLPFKQQHDDLPNLEIADAFSVVRAPVQLVPAQWTFRKINLPMSQLKDAANTPLVVNLTAGDEELKGFTGRIEHRLFTLTDDGQSFAVLGVGESSAEGDLTVFAAVPTTSKQPLFVAIEVVDFRLGQNEAAPTINFMYPGIGLDGLENTTITAIDDGKQNGVALIEVKAPSKLSLQAVANPPELRIMATLKAKSDDPAKPTWPSEYELWLKQ
jgi:hypothetical protein